MELVNSLSKERVNIRKQIINIRSDDPTVIRQLSQRLITVSNRLNRYIRKMNLEKAKEEEKKIAEHERMVENYLNQNRVKKTIEEKSSEKILNKDKDNEEDKMATICEVTDFDGQNHKIKINGGIKMRFSDIVLNEKDKK